MGRRPFLRKLILYAGCSLVGFLLSVNYLYPVAAFVGNNLATRGSLYQRTDVDQKKEYYDSLFRRYKYDFFLLRISRILDAIRSLYDLNHKGTAYKNEMELIRVFDDLAELPLETKRQTVLYIPKTLRTYWELQTHRGTNCLIAPAMTGIAMIEGVPDHLEDMESWPEPWSYVAYKKTRGSKTPVRDMSPEEMCSSAGRAGFKRVIRIDQDTEGKIKATVHTCP